MNIMDRLIKNTGGHIGVLRPYKAADGKDYVQINDRAVPMQNAATYFPFLRNVTALPLESWKALDKAVADYAKNYKSGFQDVIDNGLVHRVSEYSKLFSSQKIGSTADAVKDMDGVANRKVDSQTFDVDSVPLFVTHKDFEISWRDKGAFGASPYDGSGLAIDWDSTMIAEGVDKINDLNEKTLFQGYSVPYASNYVYGYTNKTGRNEVSLAYDWLDSGTDPSEIFIDVLDMYYAATAENKQPMSKLYLYIDSSVQFRFQEDYKSYSDRTLYNRVMALEGMEAIRVTDQLPSYKQAVMVRMDVRSVRIIQGTPGIIPVMWFDNMSMQDNLKLLSIQEPQLRVDAEGYTSITHGTKA